jgi:hypothetical protein
MNNEAKTNPQQPKQQQGKHDPTRSVNPSDTKTNPSLENQSPGNRPQDISKKNPSQDSDFSTKVKRSQKIRSEGLPEPFFCGTSRKDKSPG